MGKTYRPKRCLARIGFSTPSPLVRLVAVADEPVEDLMAEERELASAGFAVSGDDSFTNPSSANTLEADFWYDTSDPSQILGEAPFAAFVTVEGTAGIEAKSGRTIYNLRLERGLRGSLPATFQASQLGMSSPESRGLSRGSLFSRRGSHT